MAIFYKLHVICITIIGMLFSQFIVNAQNNNMTTTSYQQPNISTSTFQTTPSLTVSSLVVDVLQSATGDQIVLSNNVYEWNVSLIVQLINETDPEYLYDPTNIELMTAVLPDYIIKQLPVDLLIYHGLCTYIDNTTAAYQECLSVDIITAPPLDFCIGPLIHTDLPNPVKQEANLDGFNTSSLGPPFDQIFADAIANISDPFGECGLSCSSGSSVFGLSPDEQDIVNMFKIIGCALCAVAIVFLAVNQYIDQKKTGKKFADKPLLQIIPYVITFSLFWIVFLMTLGEMIGPEKIMCVDHDYGDYDEEKLEFSYDNPGGGLNAACTIQGVLFYGNILVYMFYTAFLPFVIFRQLYSPMKPFWGIRQRYWHLIMMSIVFIFIIIALGVNSFGGVYPMGVCLPGTNGRYELLSLLVIPMFISCITAAIFLCLSSYLLRSELKKQKSTTNKDSTFRIQDLFKRMLLYGIGVVACLALLTATGMSFYESIDPLEVEQTRIIACQIANVFLEEFDLELLDCSRHEQLHVFWFLSWVICCILGVGAQTMLACHTEVRSRLKRVATLKDVGSQLRKLGSTMAGSKSHSPNSPNSPKGSKIKLKINKKQKNTITALSNSVATSTTNYNDTATPVTPQIKYDDDDDNGDAYDNVGSVEMQSNKPPIDLIGVASGSEYEDNDNDLTTSDMP